VKDRVRGEREQKNEGGEEDGRKFQCAEGGYIFLRLEFFPFFIVIPKKTFPLLKVEEGERRGIEGKVVRDYVCVCITME
jgi:hypothetical protein